MDSWLIKSNTVSKDQTNKSKILKHQKKTSIHNKTDDKPIFQINQTFDTNIISIIFYL